MEGLFPQEQSCPHCGAQLRLMGPFCASCMMDFREMDEVVAAIARQREAQEIMGKKNFFGVKEAMKYFEVHPTGQDLKALAKIPFSKSVLKRLKNTHILVAVFPLSIFDIRKMNPRLFFSSDWYNDESFDKERGKARWQLVRKTPAPKSISKNWRKLYHIAKDDEVPTSQVMVYTIIGHYLAAGCRLFKDIYVETSSLNSDGYRVYVGYFSLTGLGSVGLCIYYYDFGDYYYYSFGVSSARKF